MYISFAWDVTDLFQEQVNGLVRGHRDHELIESGFGHFAQMVAFACILQSGQLRIKAGVANDDLKLLLAQARNEVWQERLFMLPNLLKELV